MSIWKPDCLQVFNITEKLISIIVLGLRTKSISSFPEVRTNTRTKLTKDSPVLAHTWFLDQLFPLLERFVQLKSPKKKGRNRMARRRNLLWRKLKKINNRIQSSSSIPKITKLIQDKWDLEQQLKSEYSSLNKKDEDQALQNMKQNPKSFFSFAKTRQKTRARIGPFLDPSTGQPNPSPDFAASLLSDQYKSVFVLYIQDKSGLLKMWRISSHILEVVLSSQMFNSPKWTLK